PEAYASGYILAAPSGLDHSPTKVSSSVRKSFCLRTGLSDQFANGPPDESPPENVGHGRWRVKNANHGSVTEDNRLLQPGGPARGHSAFSPGNPQSQGRWNSTADRRILAFHG
ncbi:MAG: hypothetical protein ACOCZU_09325, partial [Planctomycetota bacterium]